MRGLGKDRVQTTLMLYPNLYYNGPCCSDVQVYIYFLNRITNAPWVVGLGDGTG